MTDTWLQAINDVNIVGCVLVVFRKAFDLVDHKLLLQKLKDYKINKLKIVSEYDQEIPQSQTADNPMAPRGRAAQPSQDTRKTNYAKQSALSSFVVRIVSKSQNSTSEHQYKSVKNWKCIIWCTTGFHLRSSAVFDIFK